MNLLISLDANKPPNFTTVMYNSLLSPFLYVSMHYHKYIAPQFISDIGVILSNSLLQTSNNNPSAGQKLLSNPKENSDFITVSSVPGIAGNQLGIRDAFFTTTGEDTLAMNDVSRVNISGISDGRGGSGTASGGGSGAGVAAIGIYATAEFTRLGAAGDQANIPSCNIHLNSTNSFGAVGTFQSTSVMQVDHEQAASTAGANDELGSSFQQNAHRSSSFFLHTRRGGGGIDGRSGYQTLATTSLSTAGSMQLPHTAAPSRANHQEPYPPAKVNKLHIRSNSVS